MTTTFLIVATWGDGVFVYRAGTRGRELVGRGVRGLALDRDGGILAIVDGHSVRRRSRDGAWSVLATSPLDLACLTVAGDSIYVGTDDARVLRVTRDGRVNPLAGFDSVPGRAAWYAGSAVVAGRVVGPPLGVRSMTATVDGAVLLANVHVGGIPRSTDGGSTWNPTIEIDADVHEVRAHPAQPRSVVAAAAIGLCVSRDGGATWTVERKGLHATYCSAVASAGDDVYVAAATDHFASEGAVYRRSLNATGPLEQLRGFPRGLEGIVDTGCIAASAQFLAIADKGGNVHLSQDAGRTWDPLDQGLPAPSQLVLC